ncbi:hypothetical protein B0H13DRAFT_1881515 [Mycena leptocephala]|nr:hypothetical protein B0H13DRAFT_1881515 [Mycena leptocephala]
MNPIHLVVDCASLEAPEDFYLVRSRHLSITPQDGHTAQYSPVPFPPVHPKNHHVMTRLSPSNAPPLYRWMTERTQRTLPSFVRHPVSPPLATRATPSALSDLSQIPPLAVAAAGFLDVDTTWLRTLGKLGDELREDEGDDHQVEYYYARCPLAHAPVHYRLSGAWLHCIALQRRSPESIVTSHAGHWCIRAAVHLPTNRSTIYQQRSGVKRQEINEHLMELAPTPQIVNFMCGNVAV